MKKAKYFTVYDLVMVGVMAAVCFVTTMFLKFEIPTPTGPTMIKVANVFCLLAGMMLGGIKGGLAAGIGSFLFDLTNPAFISDAPITFLNFFLMAFVCGIIFNLAEKSKSKGMFIVWTVLAAVGGQAVYVFLRMGKEILRLVLAGSTLEAAVGGNMIKLVSSLVNMAIAVPCAVILAPIVITALKKAKIYQKITKKYHGDNQAPQMAVADHSA